MLSIQSEQDQLLNNWSNINFTRLQRVAGKIHKNLERQSTYSVVGTQIRGFHNILGYKAWDTVAKGGVCSGAMYRTKEFINTPQQLRTSVKSSDGAVHIEHTVPVKILYTVLLEKVQTGQKNIDSNQFLYFLLQSSLTTAMMRDEGHAYSQKNAKGLVLPKHSHTSNVFNPDHEHYGRPFMRYTAQTNLPEIYNVLTGELVDVTMFTMNDYRRDFAKLLAEVSAPNWLLSFASE